MARISEVSRNPGFRMQKNLILLNRSLWKSETEIRAALSAVVDAYNSTSSYSGFLRLGVSDTVYAEHTWNNRLIARGTASALSSPTMFDVRLVDNSGTSTSVSYTALFKGVLEVNTTTTAGYIVGQKFEVIETRPVNDLVGMELQIYPKDCFYYARAGYFTASVQTNSSTIPFVSGFASYVTGQGNVAVAAGFESTVPSAAGPGMIGTGYAAYLYDVWDGGYHPTSFQFLYCDASSVNSAVNGNIHMNGGDYNTGHFSFGSYGHIWRDTTNNIVRLKGDAAPTATTSGIGFNNTTTAIGATTTVTLGKTGGSGPGTVAQNKWLKIWVDATAYYVPLWV